MTRTTAAKGTKKEKINDGSTHASRKLGRVMEQEQQNYLNNTFAPGSFAYSLLQRLTEAPKKGKALDLASQKLLFTKLHEVTEGQEPDSFSLIKMGELLGAAHINKDLLDAELPYIKEHLDNASPDTSRSIAYALCSSGTTLFEGCPERKSAAYVISFFEKHLSNTTPEVAFSMSSYLAELLFEDAAEEPAAQEKLGALHEDVIVRYLKKKPIAAIQQIIKTKNPKRIEKFVLPFIQGNDIAGGNLLLLIENSDISIPRLRDSFNQTAMTIAMPAIQQIEEAQSAIQQQQSKIKKLQDALKQAERNLGRAEMKKEKAEELLSDTQLRTNFVNALNKTTIKEMIKGRNFTSVTVAKPTDNKIA